MLIDFELMAAVKNGKASKEKEDGASKEKDNGTQLHADVAASTISPDGGLYIAHQEKRSAGREGGGISSEGSITIQDQDPRFLCVHAEWRSEGRGRDRIVVVCNCGL